MTRDEIIKTIRQLWVEELEVEQEEFSNDESMFDLGGTSLQGGYIFDGIREECGVKLMVHLMFENDTVNAMANLVEEKLKEKNQ